MRVGTSAATALVFFAVSATVGLTVATWNNHPEAAQLASAAAMRPPIVRAALDRLPELRTENGIVAPLPPAAEPPAGPAVERLVIGRGDTVMGLLLDAGIERSDAFLASRALARRYDPRRLRRGQTLSVIVEHGSKGRPRLVALDLALGARRHVVVSRQGRSFHARRQAAPFDPGVVAEPPGTPGLRTLELRRGDTLMKLLVAAGSRRLDADRAISAIARYVDLRRLQIGQKLTVVFGDSATAPALVAVSLALGGERFVVAARADDGSFRARRAKAPLVRALAPPLAKPAKTEAPVPPTADDGTLYRTLDARKGDTLMSLLLRAGSSRRDADAAIEALSRHYDPRRLQIGQALTVVLERAAGTRPRLTRVSLAVGADRVVVAGRGGDGGFTSGPGPTPLADAMDQAMAAAAPAAPPVTFAALPDETVSATTALDKGDTLMAALMRIGSDRRDAAAAIASAGRVLDLRRLQVGKRITAVFTIDGSGVRRTLARLTLTTEPGRRVEVGRGDDGGFATREVEIPLERALIHAGGRIETSLYDAARAAEVPRSILMQMIGAFSYDVDFQRELHRGDRFEVLFERYLDESGTVVRDGEVLYAALAQAGGTLKLYRFRDRQGRTDYYTEDGQSVRKALLRTPIDGARLTSGYGLRKDPIRGYTRMHRGVDFGARAGTPIMAAGNGVVERAGWYGGYGRYVRIRHRSGYGTAYAHMRRIAKGIRRGVRVRQGQVIGYVGSSGHSTGPHLHYEVLFNGRQINPMKVKLPSGEKLRTADLDAFRSWRDELERTLAAVPLVRHVAEATPVACAAVGC